VVENGLALVPFMLISQATPWRRWRWWLQEFPRTGAGCC
jgi:hypothetical protein